MTPPPPLEPHAPHPPSNSSCVRAKYSTHPVSLLDLQVNLSRSKALGIFVRKRCQVQRTAKRCCNAPLTIIFDAYFGAQHSSERNCQGAHPGAEGQRDGVGEWLTDLARSRWGAFKPAQELNTLSCSSHNSEATIPARYTNLVNCMQSLLATCFS